MDILELFGNTGFIGCVVIICIITAVVLFKKKKKLPAVLFCLLAICGIFALSAVLLLIGGID